MALTLKVTGDLTFMLFLVKTLIEQEVKNGIPSNRIILGGFSQVRLNLGGISVPTVYLSRSLWFQSFFFLEDVTDSDILLTFRAELSLNGIIAFLVFSLQQ